MLGPAAVPFVTAGSPKLLKHRTSRARGGGEEEEEGAWEVRRGMGGRVGGGG